MLSISKILTFAFLAIFSTIVTFIMITLIIKHCSLSLTINSRFKCNLGMHLHGIYIYMTIISQFITPIVSHLNVI